MGMKEEVMAPSASIVRNRCGNLYAKMKTSAMAFAPMVIAKRISRTNPSIRLMAVQVAKIVAERIIFIS